MGYPPTQLRSQRRKAFLQAQNFPTQNLSPPILQDSIQPSAGGVSGSAANSNEEAAGGSNFGAGDATAFGTFLVKAANIPASVVGVVDVPYRGRMLKIAGDRTFEPWTVTILNDQSFKFRAFFESWSSNIQALQQNFQNSNTIADYQAMAKVRQMDRKGSIIRTYKFEGIWPSNISAIELDWGNNDTPEEYTVEFQVQYWTYDNDINTGNNSGSSQL